MTDLAERYLACWNETDPATRRKLIERTWHQNAVYTDPLADAHGIDAIEATITAVQNQFPDFVFTQVGQVDTHHQQTRFQWGLGPAGAEPAVIGFDVVVTAEDGSIKQVLGFLDKVPA